MGDATLTANVTAVLEDESFQAEVDAERATLRAAADAPTDLQAHEPSDSPAPATPRSSPAAAVHMPSSAASDDKVAAALDECVEELVAHLVLVAPRNPNPKAGAIHTPVLPSGPFSPFSFGTN